MITLPEFRSAVRFAQEGSFLPDSDLHGDQHWRAVAMQGLTLAAINNLQPQAHKIAVLFGLFHDCRRLDDGYDPDHGKRGAQAILDSPIRNSIAPSALEILIPSCEQHDEGHTTTNVHVGIGWDADRSVLTRVGIEPHFAFFSVVRETDFVDFVASGIEKTRNPPTWDQLWEMAFSGR